MLPSGTNGLLPLCLLRVSSTTVTTSQPPRDEEVYDHGEESPGDIVHVPFLPGKEPMSTGKMHQFIEIHGEDHVADGMISLCQHSPDEEREEVTPTWRAESRSQKNLLNRERLC